jgi:DNA recombination protein RmuC
MELASLIIAACGATGSFALGYLFSSSRSQAIHLENAAERAQLLERVSQLSSQIDSERQFFSSTETALKNSFRALSQEALQANSSQLLNLSKGQLDGKHALIDSLGRQLVERLGAVDTFLKELELRRNASEGEIKSQLRSLADYTNSLSGETARLRGALSNTRHLGTWGEAQLRNVLSSSGLLPYCDFTEQAVTRENGSQARPDVIIRLPNGRSVIVDAKAPGQAFLEAALAESEAGRAQHLKSFCEAIRRHIRATGQRKYPSLFPNALPFTLVFLPGESFLFAVLESDPEIIREAEEHDVLLCTPLSLIAFLKTVALSWKEANIHAHAEEIRTLGYELFERLSTFVEGFNSVGKSLGNAVKQFNQAAGSLEKRVLVTARRFREIEGGHEITEASPRPIEETPDIITQ